MWRNLQPLGTGGNVKWSKWYGKQSFFEKLKIESHIIQQFHFWVYISKRIDSLGKIVVHPHS